MYSLDYSDAILLYYLFVAKIFPTFLTYLVDKYFNINIKFKSISLLNASVQNIQVKWSGHEISVGELGLKSKYLSSEYKKPFCIEIEDVKFCQTFDHDLEVDKKQKSQASATNEKRKVDDNSTRHFRSLRNNFIKILNYLLQFLPPTAMIIAQLVGIHIKNFSTVVLNRERGPVASLNVPALNLTFDGCVVKNNRTLFIALALQHIKSKFYAYNKQTPSRKPHQACLAEVTVDFSLEARVAWCQRKLQYEKLNIIVNNTQVTFNGGLFDIIEHCMLHTKPTITTSLQALEPAPVITDTRNSRLDVDKLIAALTPTIMVVHVENTEVKSLNKQSSYHYHLLLQHIDVKAKFVSPGAIRAKITNLRIYTPVQEVLHVKELSIQASLISTRLQVDVKLATVEAVYCHDDIYGWFRKIFLAGMKSNRKELIIRAFRTMKEKIIELHYSEFTQALFRRVVVNFTVSLHNFKLVPQLDDQISSINISSFKCLLSQSDEQTRCHFYEDYTMNLILKDRCWAFEIITDSPLCWFMGQKFDYLDVDVKKAYIRGSALYVEGFRVKLSGSEDDLLNFYLRIDTPRVEYSQKLTCFVVQSVESFKQYSDLFNQLSSPNAQESNSDGKVSISIESILSKITIDAKISQVSCFFINRHDVCVFVNILEISSIDSFKYLLDTFEVSTVDFGKYDVCDLAEFSTTYISTKTLQINLLVTNNHPQICIDFSEKLDCSWNAHFLRHLLSLARDFHNFKSGIATAAGMARERTSILPHALPVGLDIKKLRNISIKHADMNVDKLILLINELSGENLFFYHYFH